MGYGVSDQRFFFHIQDSIPMSRLDPTLQEPDIQINDSDDVFNSWKHDQLATAEALLTSAILESSNPSHHLLTNRALVRARLEQWNAALIDAETVFILLIPHVMIPTSISTKAVNMQPSVMSYIAKSIAHVGLGESHKGYHACDIAFEHFHPSHGTFIRLMKVCILRIRVPLSGLFSSGYRLFCGRRAPGCDIPRRRPHRYSALPLNMLCSSGVFTMRWHVANISSAFSQGIYVYSHWKVAHGMQ